MTPEFPRVSRSDKSDFTTIRSALFEPWYYHYLNSHLNSCLMRIFTFFFLTSLNSRAQTSAQFSQFSSHVFLLGMVGIPGHHSPEHNFFVRCRQVEGDRR